MEAATRQLTDTMLMRLRFKLASAAGVGVSMWALLFAMCSSELFVGRLRETVGLVELYFSGVTPGNSILPLATWCTLVHPKKKFEQAIV